MRVIGEQVAGAHPLTGVLWPTFSAPHNVFQLCMEENQAESRTATLVVCLTAGSLRRGCIWLRSGPVCIAHCLKIR